MPIFMRIEGIKGNVTEPNHRNAVGSNGGVWKTTNFLANDAARSGGPGDGPHVKVFGGSTGSGLMEVSRISLSTGANSVEASDPAAKFKIGQMINTARSQRTPIKVFLCPSDSRVSTFDAQGRLIVGTDQGVWHSAASRKPHIFKNIKQMPMPALNQASVEIIITDASGMVLDLHRFERTTVSRHPVGVNVIFSDGSVH